MYNNHKRISDEKIIDFVFKENNNLYGVNDYLKKNEINEGIFDVAMKGFNNIKNPKEAFKKDAKDAGKALLNFLAFNKVCKNIAANLNKNWALKRQTGDMVKDVYKQSLLVLAFFYKSKYKPIIWRGFNQYYSWDLALASIFLYESFKNNSNMTYAYSQSTKVTPVILKNKILEYQKKITSKILDIDRTTLDVIDADAVEYGGRGGGGFFSGGSDDRLDKLVTIMKPNMLKFITPLLLIAEYERIKTLKDTEGFTESDLKYIDNIIEALNELNKIWKKVTGKPNQDLGKAITLSRSTMKFGDLFSLKDSSGKELKIDATRPGDNKVSIENDFNIENVTGADSQKIKLKIMYSHILYYLKAKSVSLSPINNFIVTVITKM